MVRRMLEVEEKLKSQISGLIEKSKPSNHVDE